MSILMNIRTRIAPSPTGSPHVGTAYQALINYSLAKKYNGKFIVRIEDTDRKRFVEGAEEEIYKALDWLGLSEDESPRKGGGFAPYRQSERLELYRKYALELVTRGKAYFCFCSEERLTELREQQQAKGQITRYDSLCASLDLKQSLKKYQAGEKAVIRLKIPKDGKTIVEDPIRGKIEFQNSELDDIILLKSDGFPTYHLAVVVDDHLMQITHPLRGEEWVPSYPKHKIIYDAFGWEMPLYTHTPIIRGSKKEKLGKRFGHSAIFWYIKSGILPQALLNYLALLGWSHPQGKEFFPLQEFIAQIELKDLSAVGPVFDLQKLLWLNNQWMKSLDEEVLYKYLLGHLEALEEKDLLEKVENQKEFTLKLLALAKERMQSLADFKTLTTPFFGSEDDYKKLFAENKSKIQLKGEDLEKVKAALQMLDSWEEEKIKEAVLKLYDEHFAHIKKKDFFVPLYILVTGSPQGLPLFNVMEILGKEKALKRLNF